MVVVAPTAATITDKLFLFGIHVRSKLCQWGAFVFPNTNNDSEHSEFN